MWAAILVIAALSAPNAASAHTAHIYHVPTAASSTLHSMESRSHQAATYHAAETVLVALNQDGLPAATPPSGGCAGGCCVAGIGCCAAMPACTTNTLADVEKTAELVLMTFASPAGIEPEAQARPPRTLA